MLWAWLLVSIFGGGCFALCVVFVQGRLCEGVAGSSMWPACRWTHGIGGFAAVMSSCAGFTATKQGSSRFRPVMCGQCAQIFLFYAVCELAIMCASRWICIRSALHFLARWVHSPNNFLCMLLCARDSAGAGVAGDGEACGFLRLIVSSRGCPNWCPELSVSCTGARKPAGIGWGGGLIYIFAFVVLVRPVAGCSAPVGAAGQGISHSQLLHAPTGSCACLITSASTIADCSHEPKHPCASHEGFRDLSTRFFVGVRFWVCSHIAIQ